MVLGAEEGVFKLIAAFSANHQQGFAGIEQKTGLKN